MDENNRTMKKFFDWLSRNAFVKNLILALCAIIIFVFAINILLGLFTRHNVHEVVPDFHNMTVEEAERLARDGDLCIEINDSIYMQHYRPGVILYQTPQGGTEVKSGRRVLVTTNAHTRRMVPVPYVTGVSLRQARNNLEVAGFVIDKLIYRTDIATNYVLETRFGNSVISENSTIKAEQGSGVTLVVGVNPDESTVIVPKIVGLNYRQARSQLWEVGLNVGKADLGKDIEPENRDLLRVWKQSPAYGSVVTLGTSVSLQLTLDEARVTEASIESDSEAQRLEALRKAEEAAAAEATATVDDMQ